MKVAQWKAQDTVEGLKWSGVHINDKAVIDLSTVGSASLVIRHRR
jgi:hypothetical protein